MGFSPTSFLLFGLLFSAALLVSARELAKTTEKTGSVEESKYHGHGSHGWHGGSGHGHYPPTTTTERKTLETSGVKTDHHGGGEYEQGGGEYHHGGGEYHHGGGEYHHGGGEYHHGGHCWHGCQQSTERKALETTAGAKPDHGYEHGGHGEPQGN